MALASFAIGRCDWQLPLAWPEVSRGERRGGEDSGGESA